MCGIAGYVAPDIGPLRISDEGILGAIAYRGPDARTAWSDERHVTLHHARLSIIDLEGGGQPMTDVTGRYTIVFNGAIYNYTELREAYARAGARFRTHSDTEVLLNGFALKQERVLGDLNGMFAFAVWDSVDRRLFMARDHLGKKPLYWTAVGDAILFASTSAAFHHVSGWSDELSACGLVLFSFLGGFLDDTTAHRTVKALPAAHYAWCRPGERAPAAQRYWRPCYDRKAPPREADRLEEYDALLADAIRIRLRSDVPVALSFSGGVDSGSIAALAKHRCQVDLHCYTIDYDAPEQPSAEVVLARQVARQLDLPWRHIQYDYRAELLEGLGSAYARFDQPSQQLPLVYSQRLYEAMSDHCRVVLSGNGADELFTGYLGDERQLTFDRQRRWLRRIPDALFTRLGERRRSRWSHTRLDRLSMAEWARRDMRAYACQFTTEPSVRDECEAVINRFGDELDACGIDTQVDFVMHRAIAVSTADTNYRLPDITGYAAHVEVRSPYLDYRMVEFAARLPHRLKVGRRHGEDRPKYLPRRSYERMVGAEAAWAAKRGMGDNLHWPLEFASNPKFQQALAAAYRALPLARIEAAPFMLAYNGFLDSVRRKSGLYPTGATMMNGFMLGVWLDRVYAPTATGQVL